MMRRLSDQRGIALVMALGILIVLTISTIALLTYTSSNARTSRYQKARVSAYTLAEAGVNEALSVLNLTSNNAINPSLLAARTSTYEGGTAAWSGTLDQPTATWTITSTGTVSNPTGASAVKKKLTVHVRVTPSLQQNSNNPAWNYIYSRKPWDSNTSTCEMILNNSVVVATAIYVVGDLCIQQTAGIAQSAFGTTLVVGGQLTLSNSNQNWVGASKSGGSLVVNKITAAYVAHGCKLQNNAVHSPCSSADNVYATTYGTTPPAAVDAPVPAWDNWYNGAAPGPKFPCVASRSSASSTWPVFDNDTTRNNSVATAFNLTPGTAYDCWTDGGELAWNPTTRVLTVNGTFFIDGSAYIQNGAVNSYTGMGTLYLSGTFLLKNSKLCAVVLADGSGCNTSTWNPNSSSLIVVANGNGDNGLSCPSGYSPDCDSVQLVSAYLQGGVYATHLIDLDTTSNIDGPMDGLTVILGQSVNTSFPFIQYVPNGAPGSNIVYAQPLPPTDYDG
jgi:Tfp pilus assembly protein PilX